MSKAKLSWVTGERPASSSKQNQQTIDHITPGLPIWSIAFGYSTGGAVAPFTPGRLGFYPYSITKSVFDRLWVMGQSFEGANDLTPFIELSFDSGATWTAAFPSAAASTTPTFGASSLTEIWDLNANVSGSQFLGVRLQQIMNPNNGSASLRFVGFLYLSTDTPF